MPRNDSTGARFPRLTDRRSGAWGAAGTLALHLLGWQMAQPSEWAAPPAAQPAPGEVVMVRWLPPEISPGDVAQAMPLSMLSPPQPQVEETSPPPPQAPEPPPTWTQPDTADPPQPGVQDALPSRSHDSVDSPALPVTAPDFGAVLLQPSSGQPIHLRMHIDATGTVTDVVILECLPQDEPFAAQIAAVLQQTPHVPARREGHNVPSTKDVWLQLDPVLERRPLR